MKRFLPGSVYLRFLTIISIVISENAIAFSSDPSLKFIENKNQWSSDIHFAARVPGGHMLIGPGKFAYYLVDQKHLEERHHHSHNAAEPDAGVNLNIRKHAVIVNFIGSNPNTPQPFGKSAEYYNYFLGSDASKWASGAYAYEGMIYPSFYNGIDLKVYSSGQHVKYDFTVAPYGDPSVIRIEYNGANEIQLDNGNIVVKTSLGEIIEKRPYVFQFINGEKVVVDSEYELNGNVVSFCFPKGYDPCHALVVDPLLIFSTYSGSTADNWGSTATPGEGGTLYSAGVTNVSSFGGAFPATAGALQTSYGGEYDIGILKYDSAGSTLLYATYLGGENTESPHSLVMNAAEELIVLGTTGSEDFPTSLNAFDRSYNGGSGVNNVVTYDNGTDIFIARLSKDGSQLLSSTYFGGSQNDGLNTSTLLVRNYGDQLRGDVITDADGNIYISTVTESSDLSLNTGLDLSYNGGVTDALLVKFNPDLSHVIWGTYLGGSNADASYTLKLDDQRNVFLAGGTASQDFPKLPGGYMENHKGNVDGWIVKIDHTGSAIMASTFTGTALYDQIYFIDLNSNGDVYAYGQTSGNFPITPAGVYRNPSSGQFLQKFNNALSSLVFSTTFGSGSGIPDISPTAFLVNDCNNIYMSGWGGAINIASGFWNNTTHGMPVSADAYQPTTSGSDFYFMVLTDNATRFLYGTYLGGNESRTHVDGGTSRFDKGGIVYHAVCSGCRSLNATNGPTSDFPTTANAWSASNNSNNCNNAAFKFDLSSLKARIQTNSEKRNMPGLKFVCQPDKVLFENHSTGGEIFGWDLGDGTEIIKTDTSAILHKYQNTGQYLVKLTAIDQNTCKAVDSTFTVVSVFQIQAAAQQDDEVCEGSPYQLSASGGAVYEWKMIDGTVFSNLSSPVVTPADTTEYLVHITDQNGCSLQDTVQLDVVPTMNPEFDFNRVTDCFSRPYLLVKDITDSLHADDLLFFDFGDGTTSDNNVGEHHYEKDGTYTLKLSGVRNGCVFENLVQVPVYTISVPNIITPGVPDGANDKFVIKYSDSEEIRTPGDFGLKTSLLIYNRWGRVLYENSDYQYDWSGEELAAGIYYYEVTVEGHSTCKSWLHVVK